MYDWPGEKRTGEITELFDEISQLFLLYDFLTQKIKNKTENSKNEIPQI